MRNIPLETAAPILKIILCVVAFTDLKSLILYTRLPVVCTASALHEFDAVPAVQILA